MKARNLDQNTVYFPKVDSERIEKKKAVLLRPEIHFLILKDCFFAREGSCAVMTRSENAFIFFLLLCGNTSYEEKSNSKLI